MTGEKWFKAKKHGYGATPCNWKGWAATLAAAGAMAGVSWLLLGNRYAATPDMGTILVWMAIMVAIAASFTLLAKLKTDGET